MFDVLIRHGLLVDGTGKPGYQADLGIRGQRIAAIGDLAGCSAHSIVDATGLVVCPGFVDVHQHADFTLLVDPRAESLVHQGVTTIATGQCGHSCAPVADPGLIVFNIIGYNPGWGVDIDWRSFGEYLDRLQSRGLGLNVLPMVGHGAVRLAVMGFEERPANPAEIAAMGDLVAQALDEGAAGLSWGLEYSPGRNAEQGEMDALSRIVAQRDGLYSIHVRSRADHLVAATEEAVSVAERAELPVQLSHFAPRPYAPQGAFETSLRRLEEAQRRGIRVGLDVFPSTECLSIAVALLPPWITSGSAAEVLARLGDPQVRQAAREYWAEQHSYVLRSGGAEGIVLTYAPHNPDAVGLTLPEIARQRGVDPVDATCDVLLAEGESLYTTMVRHPFATQRDMDLLISQPNCAIASDGVAAAPYGPLAEIRTTRDNYGYTARFLQEYVRERRLFTLEEGIRRLSGLPAQLADIRDRGTLVENAAADVVVFDPEGIRDLSTDADPNQYPAGIEWVLVNGAVVVERGQHSGNLPGELVRRHRAPTTT